MRLTITATTESFDINKYLIAVRDEIRKVYIKAMQRFLLAALPKVHIWTGMLRGAFRNLEDVAGKVSLDAQSKSGYRIRGTRGGGENPFVQKRVGTKIVNVSKKGFYYYPPGGGRVERTPEAGRDFATPINEILSGSLVGDKYGLTFRFRVNIAYYDKLDPKWGNSWKSGVDAFIDYVNANLQLPNPIDFHVKKTVRVG